MAGPPVQIDWSDQFLPDPEPPGFCSMPQPLPASLRSGHLQREQEHLEPEKDPEQCEQ